MRTRLFPYLALVEFSQRGPCIMSLFGKILALFNIIGAVALFCLAAMDYGKRQSWAHSVLRHDLTLRGLPLNDQEKDKQGRPLVDMIGESTLAAMFSGVGTPVKTQLEEVTRVQGLINSKVDSAKDQQGQPLVRAQSFLLARILLPLSGSYLEREQLLACRTYLASDDTLKVLQKRYQDAFDAAIQRMGPQRSFEEAFQYVLRNQEGEPSEKLTELVLDEIKTVAPTDDQVKALYQKKQPRFETLFADALKKQNEQLKTRLQARFDAAKLTADVPVSQKGQAAAAQKLTIARLLFALCAVLADDAAAAELKGLDPTTSDYATKVLGTQPYKTNLQRVYVVCGLRTTLAAIGEEASVLRRLAAAVARGQRQDQLTFILDNTTQIEDLRERAALLQTELERIADNNRKFTEQEALVKKRKAHVEEQETELKESRAKTADAIIELRKLSDQVREKRLELRDAIRKNEEAEKKVRELEAVIRARERATGAKP
jgi:hypothetical protein